MKIALTLTLVLAWTLSALAQIPNADELAYLLNNPGRPAAQPSASPEQKNLIAECHVLAESGQLEAAIKKLQTAQAKERSPVIDHALATLYLDANDSAQAIEYFHRAIDKSPNYALAHRSLGMTLLSSGSSDFETATAAFINAYRNGQQTKHDINYLGQSYLGLQRFPEAEVCYQKALQLDPDNQHYKNLLHHAQQSQ